MLYGYQCIRCEGWWASHAHPEAGYEVITRFCPDCIVRALPATIDIPVEPRNVTPGLVIAITADYFGVSVEELRGHCRMGPLAQSRHIAMYLCRELTDLSLPTIGRAFDRNHTTVYYADSKIRHDMTRRCEIFDHITELTSRIITQTAVPVPA